jgi:hypothetical protein
MRWRQLLRRARPVYASHYLVAKPPLEARQGRDQPFWLTWGGRQRGDYEHLLCP